MNSTSRDDFFIGSCKTIYTASCALISTLFKNLFPMSRTCCFMLDLPFLASTHAYHKSSLVPFCALDIYETIYIAHAYTSRTN